MGRRNLSLLGYQQDLMLSLSPMQKGFTLIELMITVTILGLLMVFGLPSYQEWIQSTQIRTAAESVQNGLQLARAEAVRRNAPVRFQLTSTTTARLSDWTVCLVAPVVPSCPVASTVQLRTGTEGSANAVVGVGTTATAFGTPIVTATLPATVVTFTGFGRITPPLAAGVSTRIDITNSTSTAARRLVLLISTGGQIRMCDPLLALATNPQGCG